MKKEFVCYHNGDDYIAEIFTPALCGGVNLNISTIDAHGRQKVTFMKTYNNEKQAIRALKYHFRGVNWKERK